MICKGSVKAQPANENMLGHFRLILTKDLDPKHDENSLAFSEDNCHLAIGIVDYGDIVQRVLKHRRYQVTMFSHFGECSLTSRTFERRQPLVVLNNSLSDAHPYRRPNDVLMLTWSSDEWRSRPVTCELRTVQSGELLASVKCESARPFSRAALSPASPVVALVRGGIRYDVDRYQNLGTVRLWTVPTNQVTQLHATDITSYPACEFSRDGEIVVVAGGHWVYAVRKVEDLEIPYVSHYEGEIITWRVSSGEQLYKINLRDHSVRVVTFSPNRKVLATGGMDGKIFFWNSQTGEKELEILMSLPTRGGASPRVESMAFSSDGKLLSVGVGSYNIGENNRWGEVRVIDVAQGAIHSAPLSNHVHVPHHVAFSPNGEFLVAVTVDGKLFVWKHGKQDVGK
jgi:WD40 repeat protein